MTSLTIRAAEFCGPDDGPVQSATRLAAEIMKAPEDVDSVIVAMEGVPGASSSFFNVIFHELAAQLGPEAVLRRVVFTGLGKIQTMIATRSRVAVLGS